MATANLIIAKTTVDSVFVITTIDDIVTSVTIEDIVTITPTDGIGTTTAINNVAAGTRIDRVITLKVSHGIGKGHACQSSRVEPIVGLGLHIRFVIEVLQACTIKHPTRTKLRVVLMRCCRVVTIPPDHIILG